MEFASKGLFCFAVVVSNNGDFAAAAFLQKAKRVSGNHIHLLLGRWFLEGKQFFEL